ncbi:MAG: hypothetical protein A2538_02440 [Candidatus Magasanikbacteria bacterium RIFOXYD2_FULL_41_14]|uniref:Homing endonuclease LAGLIDADG domain-containing protein n=1 Tax=Candidatus Magasanikbacteria bacterium RIFOXYD2_FULL_41_14 TaxID=1798709 RepID=A0A1F6PCD6_9BACT|nr:MAG: hypothetical protein A2538_02440 [Candidatus Magasanikbacteria bacterium RIFOXYD2_FULL_41_14]
MTERKEGNTEGREFVSVILTNEEKAYIAGFLDGDGSIMFQFIRRKDYVNGYQVRASIVFYQKDIHVAHLRWLKTKLNSVGYVRIRNDNMAEYTIVGIQLVLQILEQLSPYLRLKKSHVDVARKIANLLPRYQRLDKKLLLKVGKYIDQFQQLNYSKRRRNTTMAVRKFFDTPRND